MKAAMLRTNSGTVQTGIWTVPNSPRISVSLPVKESGGTEKKIGSSPSSISLYGELSRRSTIRRAVSEADISRSGTLTKLGSQCLPSSVPEEVDDGARAGDWPQSAIPVKELGFSGGGGFGKSWSSGGVGDFADRKKIGAYYEEMVKANPSDPLFLRNYGKYLHEVEGNMERSAEYYGRAILASPGDGEVLSLYGNLIWEKERDGTRAKSYFDQAVEASPDDSTVLGSYARFMWEAAEEDDDDDEERAALLPAASVVAAF